MAWGIPLVVLENRDDRLYFLEPGYFTPPGLLEPIINVDHLTPQQQERLLVILEHDDLYPESVNAFAARNALLLQTGRFDSTPTGWFEVTGDTFKRTRRKIRSCFGSRESCSADTTASIGINGKNHLIGNLREAGISTQLGPSLGPKNWSAFATSSRGGSWAAWHLRVGNFLIPFRTSGSFESGCSRGAKFVVSTADFQDQAV